MKKIMLVLIMLFLTGCAAGTKEYYKASSGYSTVTCQNAAFDIPPSVLKAESIGAFTNDHEMDKRYKSEGDGKILFAKADSYYLICFHTDLYGYEKGALSDLTEKTASIRVTDAKKVKSITSDIGIKKEIYEIDSQVLLSRDLFNDMTGYLSVLTYRNDVWIGAALSVEEKKETKKIIESLRVHDPGLIKKAYTLSDERSRDVKEKPAQGEWGQISVMDKKVCGERVQILAKVDEIYDAADSYSLFSEHDARIKALGYEIPEDETYLAARITCFYGEIDRGHYDPYVDVALVDKDGKKIGRTYRFYEEGDSFYVFFKEMNDMGGLRVEDEMVVWFQ